MAEHNYCLKEGEIATMKQQVVTLEADSRDQKRTIERVFDRIDKLLYTVWGAMIAAFVGIAVQVVRWAIEIKM